MDPGTPWQGDHGRWCPLRDAGSYELIDPFTPFLPPSLPCSSLPLLQVDGVAGYLKTFLVEPFVPHEQSTEHYVCITSDRQGDRILFTHEGGVDVGDVDAKARVLSIPVDTPFPDQDTLSSSLLMDLPDPSSAPLIASFIERLYAVYVDLHFTYLEINPMVVTGGKVYFLDLAAKLDQTAEFEAGQKWSTALAACPAFQTSSSSSKGISADGGVAISFPAPFGREMTKEEAYIAELDAKTGASLKLTVLNASGRIWTMVAGGGASVVYSDAIAAAGYADELANYGEYSGAPSEAQTYEYARTLLDLMTRAEHPSGKGKILIIGGGIANFTNVAATFKGIARALTEFSGLLRDRNVRIAVRRGGPNWQEGLRAVRRLGEELNLPLKVFGPETHITAIVPIALSDEGWTPGSSKEEAGLAAAQDAGATLGGGNGTSTPGPSITPGPSTTSPLASVPNTPFAGPQGQYFPPSNEEESSSSSSSWSPFFSPTTTSIVYGLQPKAVQGMLDFDYICKRETPSVAAMVYPFGGNHQQKLYWGTQETLIPVYTSFSEAQERHPHADVVVNFASCRSVYPSTMDILNRATLTSEDGSKERRVRAIAIIAEGVPERRSRQILHAASKAGVLIIGPATVGGIRPGAFKIGNTGGMMDNIVASRLYRPGSVGYVSKSGGMSNELNNILAHTTNGVLEGVAIGGDRYPGSTFLDHLLRYEADPDCKLLLLLGEVGGDEEYRVAEAIRSGAITKPLVAWCIGTCAGMFQTEVQFGHAGALANSDRETASAKNRALKEAGALVPDTFEDLPTLLTQIYGGLVSSGRVVPQPEPEPPKIPVDYAWAQELGLVRKPAAFVSTICDDRGQELLYAGMRISDVFREEIGIGGVLSLLWFKRRLPAYASKFLEMVLMLTADHGPAVSGAHNTIVTARAGKDLVSSLTSGLLTIGERFGGALDGAAEQFSAAHDASMTPRQFVDSMRRSNRLILGIGHKIKSRTNPDLRVKLICEYARAHFPATPILDFAQAVETVTTAKKDNLILNVDGAIAVLFVDLLRHSGAFTREEADEYVKMGALNGLFVLGRSIGFIGHYLDQKRLKQGLYRHPWDDISYLLPEASSTTRAFVGASKMEKAARK